jgi:hypothetical protein
MNADQKELTDVSGIIGDDGTVDGDIWTVRSGSFDKHNNADCDWSSPMRCQDCLPHAVPHLSPWGEGPPQRQSVQDDLKGSPSRGTVFG